MKQVWLKPTVEADPDRHGGVWGPWDLTNPTVDYEPMIGVTTEKSSTHKSKVDPSAYLLGNIWTYLFRNLFSS